MSLAAAHAQQAWLEAREEGDYKHFAPSLERMTELQHRYIACFDGTGEFAHPYDVLLDDYEPGLTTAEVRSLFTVLREEARPARLRGRAAAGEGGRVFPGHYPVEDQRRFAEELLGAVGYDPEHWRLDPSVHPFARSLAHTDVRLTTRWEPDDLAMSFYSCLHEFGHGLYEAQMSPSHYRTTARRRGRARHARVPEPAVGEPRRPREAVLRWVLPVLRRNLGGHFDAQDASDLYRAVNQVRLSLIRIEADETTYNLHIALRFELELALVEGRLSVADLPDAWNEATHRLLGLETPSIGGASCRTSTGRGDDRLLPDVHDRQPDGRPAVAGVAGRRAGHRRGDRRG